MQMMVLKLQLMLCTTGSVQVQVLVGASTVRVASSSNPVVVATGGVEANGTAFPMIIVGPEDVSQTEGFDCEVTVP